MGCSGFDRECSGWYRDFYALFAKMDSEANDGRMAAKG